MKGRARGRGRSCLHAIGWVVLAATVAAPARGALRPCEHWAPVLTGTAPAPRYGAAMVWDGDRDVAILFGGISANEDVYNDVWEFQPATATWSPVAVIGASPLARFHAAMAYDSTRKRVLMFGGQEDTDGDDANDFFSDLWEYDPAARTWTQMPQPGSSPIWRSGAALAYDPVRQRTVLFGGFERTSYFNTTWEWDGSAWTQSAPAHRPDERAFHAMAWSGALGKMVLLGGFVFDDTTFNTVFNDTWTWDGTDWTELNVQTERGCSGHSMSYDPTRGHLIVFGNCSQSEGDDNTLVFEAPYDTWARVRNDGPPPRTLAAMVVSDAGQAILFGGRNFADARGDTWVLKGFKPEIGTPPLARESGPCLQNQFHVFARTDVQGAGPFTYRWRKYTETGFNQVEDGFRFSGAHTDTLILDPFRPEDVGTYAALVSNECGTTESARASLAIADGHWTQSSPLPSRRHSHQLAYDTARQRMVTFGGRTIRDNFGLTIFGDTLERNGIAWQPVVPSGASPAPRYGYALAYDAARGVTVMHGGLTSDASFNGTEFGDTWEWDGTSWSLRTTMGPSQRHSHQMVWDAARQRVVLFGGRSGQNTFFGDLWEWDGATWTARGTVGDPTYGHPRARYDHGLAYDALRDLLVLHGGIYLLSHPTVVGGETWELAGGQWQRRATATFDTPLYNADHRAMAYDADRQVTLIAANAEGNVVQNPLQSVSFFEWSSGAWTRKRGGPSWRTSAGMAYDPVRKATVLAGGYNACRPHVDPDCSLADTWEWEYFRYDPTCGAVACGDGLVDPAEACDGSACCTTSCTLRPVGATCVGKNCPSACTAAGSCECLPGTCGNGVVEHDEDCDGGNCCTAQCTYAPEGELCANPCNTASCHNGGSASAPTCIGGPPLPGCSSATSATGPLPGTLATPDQRVTLTMPDGVGAARTYGIAGGLSASQFGIGTPETRVLVAQLLPDGATFVPPGVTIAFRWLDNDDDGAVDGTAIGEGTLRIYHDGQPITPTCGVLAAAGCTGPPCCDPAQDVFTVQVTSFSEFVVVSDPAPGTSSTTAPPHTSTTAPSSTSTTAVSSTSTTAPPSTTTTLPACATLRCLLDEARNAPVCAGTLPRAVARKLDGAVRRVDLAPTGTPRKAARFHKAAKRLLAKAATAAGKASRGRRPRLSAECATTLRQAIGIAIGRVDT